MVLTTDIFLSSDILWKCIILKRTAFACKGPNLSSREPRCMAGLTSTEGNKIHHFQTVLKVGFFSFVAFQRCNQSNLVGSVCSILSFCPFKIIMTSNYIANRFLFSKTELATLLWCGCQSNEFRCSFIAFHLFSFHLFPFTVFNHSSLVAHQALNLSNVFSDLIQNLIWNFKAQDGSTIPL